MIPELTITLSRAGHTLCEGLASVVSCQVSQHLPDCARSPVTGGHCVHGVTPVVEAHSAQAQPSQPAVKSLKKQDNTPDITIFTAE